MKTEHIVLVGLIVLIVVFVMNQQKKESFVRKPQDPLLSKFPPCDNKNKSIGKLYYYNEGPTRNRCLYNCHCDGNRFCSTGMCTGRAR